MPATKRKLPTSPRRAAVLDTAKKRRQFLLGATMRSEHHAKKVLGVVPAVIAKVFELADKDSVSVNVAKGRMTGSGWASFSGNRVWIGYDRPTKTVEVRAGTLRGGVLYTFDEDSSPRHIEKCLNLLRTM